jgi:hypothetical protein
VIVKNTTSWDIMPCNPLKAEECITSIFKVEEKAKQETSAKAGGKPRQMDNRTTEMLKSVKRKDIIRRGTDKSLAFPISPTFILIILISHQSFVYV